MICTYQSIDFAVLTMLSGQAGAFVLLGVTVQYLSIPAFMIKIPTNSPLDSLLRLRTSFRRTSITENEEPIRSELYSFAQMNRHGELTAHSHKLVNKRPKDRLLKRLDSNEATLLEVRSLLVESILAGKQITPAAEWLLDNFYLIEEQITIARKHLPKGYSEGLPCLSGGISAGMPRVYDIVLEIIAHSDGRVDMKDLDNFISAYQDITVLTLGELWATPIMLRLAIIENLRRVSCKIALDMIDHGLADYWAEKIMKTLVEDPGSLILVIADMARSKPVLNGPFVAGFTRKLQGKGIALALPLNWVEQQLSGLGFNSDDLVQAENQKQAVNQVSVRNSIGTLRFLGTSDWREFVESLSSIEQVLRQDITGVYPLMDFETRDRYRREVEVIAKASNLSEKQVAQTVLQLSKEEAHAGQSLKYAHVGYYLVDKGKEQTEEVSRVRHTLKQKILHLSGRIPVVSYLLSIALLTLAVASGMTYIAYRYGDLHWVLLILTGILSASGAAQMAVSLVNWSVTIMVKPKFLPRMDFSKGIPSEYRTLVVVPTILSGKSYLEKLLETLEMHFLANKDDSLHFGLLTDFPDADTETLPEDDALLKLAEQRIAALNQKYRQKQDDIFFLFHRPRTWNDPESKWMGYERKRGKLSALNGLLLGRGRDKFSVIAGDHRILSQVKYVITLDSDTQLPREAAWKLVATMAHPLNRPFYDPWKKRVTEGYGILQPRLASSLSGKPGTQYTRLLGDVVGIDPYTRATSDVYQDIFAEGSFIGKGIYDVAVFEKAVHETFEENRILSHDLLEGCYARSGVVSDVLLYEEYPEQYLTESKRRHRWVRGDWQVGTWILPWVTVSNGRLSRNTLSTLSRWKLADNLRRSLLPISLLLLLLLGWTILPFPWIWTLMVTFFVLLPLMMAAGWQFIHKSVDITIKMHLSETARYIKDTLVRFVFGLAVLPYEAFIHTDAILRTNWRMIVTSRNLLEWTPSATESDKGAHQIGSVYRLMYIVPFLAVVVTGILLFFYPESVVIALPFLALWLSAPAIVWYVDQPSVERDAGLSEEQTRFLHRLARKTWAFFEVFVTEKDHWLPPDNFQIQPANLIAHRTSPTNMGLSLLSNLSAYDFGYITGVGLIRRCDRALESMSRLERYRGHFYNWYDTLSLLPLPPRYVSSVDSGNLAGHLLTLRQGFLALPHQPVFDRNIFEGLKTTAEIVLNMSKGHPAQVSSKLITLLDTAILDCESLSSIKKHLDQLVVLAQGLNMDGDDRESERYKWTSRLSQQINNIGEELTQTVPWIDLLPVPERYDRLATADQIPSMFVIRNILDQFLSPIREYSQRENNREDKEWLDKFTGSLTTASSRAMQNSRLIEKIVLQCEQLSDLDYGFLLDKSSNLSSIGYNVELQKEDVGFYDLLATEARLGIFVGIAQGKLPQECWFALGRLLTNSGEGPVLLSWSGSMFEYLMPQLVMPVYENTLLHQTAKAVVKKQIEYARQREIPWGISESAYYMVDASLSYQYRAFGVPGLGLKRGLGDDLVIAPYASMLALMVLPERACANLQVLASKGFEGEFGLFEAIDYTPSRLPRGKTHSIVPSFMVHHQGMSLLSMSYLLLDKPMQKRFVSELRFQATLLLLQERIPRVAPFYAHTADTMDTYTSYTDQLLRSIPTPDTAIPEIQLLGNGRYQVMVTNSGGGYSRWKDLAVTRWREDTTKDDRGVFCYIKDTGTGRFWSNTHQPTLQPAGGYQAIFSQGHVEFNREDFGIETKTEIVVSPEDDVEMRRIQISNKTSVVKVLEVTSYAEVVMASQASDEAHPAFSNLFVQTQIVPEHKAILCTRRPRSQQEAPPWMFHQMEVHGVATEGVSYETDRMQFIGRGKTLHHPHAMEITELSGRQGSVLDPVMAIRYRISIKPGQKATVDLIYGISETKEGCEELVNKYRDQHLKNRAFEISWTHSQLLLRQINASEADAQLYNRIAGLVVYPHRLLRAEAAVIQKNFKGQSELWSHSVSGDLPVVLLHVHNPESIGLVRQMVQAHAYWRLKGLSVDLVIWNENHGAYRQLLQEQIQGLITMEVGSHVTYNKPGSIFVKSADQLSGEDRILFESIARVIIHDNKETLSDQVNRVLLEKALPPLLKPGFEQVWKKPENPKLPGDLQFFNGTGGFTADGRAYKIITSKKKTTPTPWVNVLANPGFGTVVSESGSAYTWAVNAHEYRLTPWSNDPVSDTGGEAFYLRDEVSGRFWSPSSFPVSGSGTYVTTHGFGYSLFEHVEAGIVSELCVFVDAVLPVKFAILKIRNESGQDRKLSATGFMEIVLGDIRSKTSMHLLAERDLESGALLFRNRYQKTFADRVAFFKTDGANLSYTTDRSEFIGRNRDLGNPQAMDRSSLSGNCSAGLDTCAALQVKFDLPDGAQKEIVFQLGSAEDMPSANALLKKFSDPDVVTKSLRDTREYWEEMLGTVKIATPDNALNIMANGWLTYQVVSSRLFARSGFYQSGGAFGFRDQLQDVLALLSIRPEIARQQILLCASRQFAEGDVQHWWHPPEGRGIRTRCSDDMLWLPFAVARYIEATGDTAILEESVGFLESRSLYPGEESLYELPESGRLYGTLYEHCVCAIQYSLRFGVHGLPLIGTGDWNDGMDRVGNEGRGESVWLGFFLHDILMGFASVADKYGDSLFSETCKREATQLQGHIEKYGWDGQWYLRAWFDDGTPLGSAENKECRIDAIAQCWSVLSGAADSTRKATAMASLDHFLVDRDMNLIKLLDPPFDQNGLNPGYIKGYVPGVRENGGQYTHAAVWALMSFARLGDRKKAWELFCMINPIHHGSSADAKNTYKVEPYVMAGDVYANESHRGRGGWTWYTGSAGWMYQFITGSLVGMKLTADKLGFYPCFPEHWPSVFVAYRYGKSTYRITVFQNNTDNQSWWTMDDKRGAGNEIRLIDDGQEHEVRVSVSEKPT